MAKVRATVATPSISVPTLQSSPQPSAFMAPPLLSTPLRPLPTLPRRHSNPTDWNACSAKVSPPDERLAPGLTVVGDSSWLGSRPLSAKPIGCEMMQSQLYPFASMARLNEPDAPRSPYKPGNGLEPPYLGDRG